MVQTDGACGPRPCDYGPDLVNSTNYSLKMKSGPVRLEETFFYSKTYGRRLIERYSVTQSKKRRRYSGPTTPHPKCVRLLSYRFLGRGVGST